MAEHKDTRRGKGTKPSGRFRARVRCRAGGSSAICCLYKILRHKTPKNHKLPPASSPCIPAAPAPPADLQDSASHPLPTNLSPRTAAKRDSDGLELTVDLRTQLTNLSIRRAGRRPDWFDFEPLPLKGRIRQCHQLFWQIAEAHDARKKLFVAIHAPEGMGKTFFLAQLYTRLSQANESIVVLSPPSSNTCRPFAALRNILEQRFYLSGKATAENLKRQIDSAFRSILPDETVARAVIGELLPLWESAKDESGAGDSQLDTAQTQIIAEEACQERTASQFVDPLSTLFHHDLQKNRIVIVFDDVERYDTQSLETLALMFARFEDVPIALIVTTNDKAPLPDCFHTCCIDDLRLHSIGDSDLASVARHALEQMSRNREKLIIPPDLCRMVAQAAYGSPKRVLETMLSKFTPDNMLLWGESLEALKRQSIPRELALDLDERLAVCDPDQRQILDLASILNAPFTAHTMDAILGGQPSSLRALKSLREAGFLDISDEPLAQNTTTYVFKHEYERVLIAARVPEIVQQLSCGAAAQWYALSAAAGKLDETIGDLWQQHANPREACRWYERAAYAAQQRCQYQKAWPLFQKLLAAIPDDCPSQHLSAALDAARIGFLLGDISEAIAMNRRACLDAVRLSAFGLAARAHIQLAEIFTETGNYRQARRQLAQARRYLNFDIQPFLVASARLVEARGFFLQAQYCTALACITKVRREAGSLDAPQLHLQIDKTEADILAVTGNAARAMELLHGIVDANDTSLLSLQAQAYRSLGLLHYAMDNTSPALEAWNKSLGMAQEMNDIILHANLLADIAQCAISLQAMRTARSATEQSLIFAQQLHHQVLVARCLANNAKLQYAQEQYEKSMRTLREAHRMALKLRHVPLLSMTLHLIATCCANAKHAAYCPPKAEKVFSRLFAMLTKHRMLLRQAALLPSYADFLLETQHNIAALNALRQAREIYAKFGIKKACDKVQSSIDDLLAQTDVTTR